MNNSLHLVYIIKIMAMHRYLATTKYNYQNGKVSNYIVESITSVNKSFRENTILLTKIALIIYPSITSRFQLI